MSRQVTLERVFIHPVVFTPPPPYKRVTAWLSHALSTLRSQLRAHAGPRDWNVVYPPTTTSSP